MDTDINALTEKAVETAKEFNVALDYTPESIPVLEEFLHRLQNTITSQDLPEQIIWNLAASYGAYLGETLLRNGLSDCGFEWDETENGLPVLKRDENWMSPISKAYKRLTFGKEDDLESFYTISLSLGRGEINLPG